MPLLSYFFSSPKLLFFFLSKLCQDIADYMNIDQAALFSYLTIQMHQHLLLSALPLFSRHFSPCASKPFYGEGLAHPLLTLFPEAQVQKCFIAPHIRKPFTSQKMEKKTFKKYIYFKKLNLVPRCLPTA